MRTDEGDILYVWGDYIRLRPHYGIPNGWDAAGFVLEGGDDRKNIQPYYFTIQHQTIGSELPPFPLGPFQPSFPQ